MPTVERLTEPQIQAELQQLSGWERTGVQISKPYAFKDFVEAMAFVNRVAALAERANHHPDITIRYQRVILTLATHDVGGLTGQDCLLAKQIDGAVAG